MSGGDRFQVKRIFVNPGKRLSLQKHHHRSEHWVIVHGTAEVQIGDTVSMLGENESVYIPRGEIHRLTNPGKIVLELIEVQTGSYLGEDDIIRLDDEFGGVDRVRGRSAKTRSSMSSGSSEPPCSTRLAFSGTSNGESMPVKFLISPRRALA